MHKTVLFFLALVILCAGCVSLSTFQTARVLQENESQFGAAASINSNYTLLLIEEDSEFINTRPLLDFNGTFEAFYRTSINNNFDIGMKAYFMGVIIDGKYQFHDGERFAIAADLGIGYNRFSGGDSILDFYPTLLMTFDLSKNVDLTFAPKIIIARFISGVTESSTLLGGTMMLTFGKFMPEIGYYVSEDDNIATFSVGMNLNR